MKALREAYGECLRKYGQANEKVVVLMRISRPVQNP